MANASIPRDQLAPAAYSVDQVCVVLGVSRPTVYKLIGAGKLRTVMVGRRRLIPATEIDRLLADDN